MLTSLRDESMPLSVYGSTRHYLVCAQRIKKSALSTAALFVVSTRTS